jgi:NAD(P)-dependent dehydrogenase (short-subunit alcohol dehydrogenase family)
LAVGAAIGHEGLLRTAASVARGILEVMVALVTGAAVGIGRAIALALLARGMDTWLADGQDPGSALMATELALEHDARAIVNIASVAGIETIPHRSPAYDAAKAGLIRSSCCDKHRTPPPTPQGRPSARPR